MIYCGIDPGVVPAVAVISGSEARVFRLKGDPKVHKGSFEQQLVRVLTQEKPAITVLELVGPIAGQGLVSSCNLMKSWGMIRGVLAAFDLPYVLVTPSVWKRDILAGYDLGDELSPTDKKKMQKASAVEHAIAMFPNTPLKLKGCRVPDHNLAEAIAMACWARKHYGGQHG